jgi:putative DNA primase/helicase
MTAAHLRDVDLVAVVRALGGPEPHGGRLRAWWRDGDGPNVSICPERGQWFDHARGEGGGVLSLVKTVMLTDDAGALRWLTEGGFLEDRPMATKARRGDSFGPVVARYTYTDEHGAPVYQVRRHEPKRFSQWRREGGEWLPGLLRCPRLLYRLPEVLTAPIVFIVEGEKDVESLRDMGFVATTCSGGAGKWNHDNDHYFSGREVIIIPDNDRPGLALARDVAAGLLPHAARVSVLILEGAKDITAWFEAGHSEVELIAHVEGKEAAHAD